MQRAISGAVNGPIGSITKFWLAILSLLVLCNSAVAQTSSKGSYNDATFGDWLVNCTAFGIDKGLECIMSQRIEFEDNSEPLLKIDLYLNPKSNQPEAIFILPLGIPLAKRPILSFNHSKDFLLSVSHCHSDGCYFKTPLNKILLETFLSMRSGQVTLNGNNNETIKIPISGNGSRAAYNYFTALPKN